MADSDVVGSGISTCGGNGIAGSQQVTSSEQEPSSTEFGRLVILVIDDNATLLEDAEVNVDGLGTRRTDRYGKTNYEKVEVGTYTFSAQKKGYDVTLWKWPVTVTVIAGKTATGKVQLHPCITHQLTKPFLIARASANLTPPIQDPISIPDSVDKTLKLTFGEDSTYGTDGIPVTEVTVGTTEADLKAKMSKLVEIYAGDDTDGYTKSEFDKFQSKQKKIMVYHDLKLDKAIAADEQFITYPDRTLAAPGTPFSNPPKARIHQALEEAGWDVNKVKPLTDLGVPAFNKGIYGWPRTGDYANGLFTLMDAVQYVLVFVDQYEYDSCKKQYTIHLVFEVYDVFGLDNEDVKKYGARSEQDGPQWPHERAITAWWQLQHQFNYAPLVTMAVVTREFTVSTLPVLPTATTYPKGF